MTQTVFSIHAKLWQNCGIRLSRDPLLGHMKGRGKESRSPREVGFTREEEITGHAMVRR